MRGEAEVTAFDKYSTSLLCVLKSAFDNTRIYRSPATKRQKLWSDFHQLRVKRLPKIWEELFKALNLQVDDPFLQQSVNQEVFAVANLEIQKGGFSHWRASKFFGCHAHFRHAGSLNRISRSNSRPRQMSGDQ